MSTTVEVVRFDVPPERAEALVAGHETARLAIDSLAPGWIWSRLARFDRRSWVELVAWRDRAEFERALELSADDPVAAAWFDLADPGWSIVLGRPVEDERQPPPAEGTLELALAGPGEGSPPPASADPEWSMLLELEERVWWGESWQASPPGELRITTSTAPAGVTVRPGTEVATIAHSCDAAAGDRA